MPELLDEIPSGVVVLDRDFRVVRENRFVREWSGRSSAELVGRHCFQVFHDRTEVCAGCPTAEAFKTGERASLQHTGIGQAGCATYASITAYPLHDAQGEVRFVLEHVTDLAEQTRFEQERKTARDALVARNIELEVLNAISIAITSSLDLDAILDHTLEAVLRVTGLTPSGGIFLVDEDLKELRLVAHRGLSPEFVEAEQRIKMGECLCGLAAATGEFVESHRSDQDDRHTRLRTVHAHSHIVVPLSAHGRTQGVMFLYPPAEHVLDDAARRLFSTIGRQVGIVIENALLYENTDAELRRKVVELGAALQETERERAKANTVQRLKDDYVAMISHDLRTPLAGMMAQADLLRRRATRDENGATVATAEAIIRGGQRMNVMITDLVESARLESGQVSLELETLRPAVLVGDVLDMLPAQERRRVSLADAGEVPKVRADRQRIGRAVTNLVTNALKYSAADASVNVTLTSSPAEVTISVEDRGIGIDAQALPRVFERFYRATGVTGPDGLGLGLYITRLLVEAHGGRISATSAKGQGSTFRLTLPVARDAE